MTKHKLQARLGATAIAAALALSSTPLLAQQATPDTTQTAPSTAPATDTVPAVDSTPTVSVPDVTSATPDASTSTSTTTTKRTTVRHTVASTTRPAAATAARPTATHHTAPATTAAVAPIAAPVATVPATTTAPAPAASPPPLAQVAGPPPAAANSNQPTQQSSTAEILGAAIFALIVLGAIAFALARRRRNRAVVYEDNAYEPETAYKEAEPVHTRAPIAEEQPAIVAPETSAFAWGNRPQAGKLETPAAAKAEADEPMTLPNGFDLSRFGRHVQAAYRGPTEDNPSLSLRHRLRRAAAMDQKERAMGMQASDAPMNGEAVTEHRELADA